MSTPFPIHSNYINRRDNPDFFMFDNDKRRVFGGVVEMKDLFNTLYLMSAFTSNDPADYILENTKLELFEIDNENHIIYVFSEDSIYIYFGGTRLCNINDIIADMRMYVTDFEGMGVGYVHSGYYDHSLKADLNSVYERAKNENKQIIITGHSLGGSCATISTMMLLNRRDYNYIDSDENINIMCITYGSVPCVDEKLRDYFYSLGYKDRFLNIFFKYDFATNIMNPIKCIFANEHERLEEDPENKEGLIEYYLRTAYSCFATPFSNNIKYCVCKYSHIGRYYSIKPVFWHGSIYYIEYVYEFLQKHYYDQSVGLVDME